MLSIELIRSETDAVRRSIENRGDFVDLGRILELDEKRRSMVGVSDGLRARRNETSREISKLRDKPQELIADMRKVGTELRELDEQLRILERELDELLLLIPNVPLKEVPLGSGEDDNVVMRTSGSIKTPHFDLLPHWELGEKLGIIDLKRGAKLSGSRFFILQGKGAILQRALVSWMLDVHTRDNGYEELYLPAIVSQSVATGSGQLPKFRDNMYRDDEDDLWLIPTAEVPITGMHAGEILDPGALPIRYVAHTPCFRREKAAAGRDTRGIKRVHQFEKVEIYEFVEPGDSVSVLDSMVRHVEKLCELLRIPHRVSLLCTGDLGFASSKTYDVEMWAPGSQEWLEVSSCSDCGDFQSRRAGVRYRSEAGTRPRYPHTLNGSGLGVPRTLIAVIENYQRADGSIEIPDVLRPYTGFDTIEPG